MLNVVSLVVAVKLVGELAGIVLIPILGYSNVSKHQAMKLTKHEKSDERKEENREKLQG